MDTEAITSLAFKIGAPVAFLLITYWIGRTREQLHYASIRKREQALIGLPTLTFRAPPDDWKIESASLVVGSVVVSVDYFKRFLASLRFLAGGHVSSYEPLLDRARREALLRMREMARATQCNAIINVRLETSQIAGSRGNGKGTAGVELIAYGTALKFVQDERIGLSP
ncbi:MAG: YbjQ family protein [Myxococcales bacterium]|nr:MAG: YbjQ family protein [Myxococcales bacterium]